MDVPEGVTVIKVADSRYAMALIAAAWYGHPASQLKVIGINGNQRKDHHHLHGKIHSGKRRI